MNASLSTGLSLSFQLIDVIQELKPGSLDGSDAGFQELIVDDPLPVVSRLGGKNGDIKDKVLQVLNSEEKKILDEKKALEEERAVLEEEKISQLREENIKRIKASNPEIRKLKEKELCDPKENRFVRRMDQEEMNKKVEAFIHSLPNFKPSKNSAKLKKRVEAIFDQHAITTPIAQEGVVHLRRQNGEGVSIEESKGKAYALISYPIGNGKFKKVKLVARMEDQQFFARATAPLKPGFFKKEHEEKLNLIAREIKMQTLFSGEDEFVQVIYSHKFPYKNSILERNLEKYAIVMEYCPEGDFEHFLNSSKAISPEVKNPQIIRYFSNLFSALRKMEELAVLHRDIKPANLLLKDGCAKIGDFGFAMTEADQIDLLSKNPNEVAGTPMYFAPEYLVRSSYITTKLAFIKDNGGEERLRLEEMLESRGDKIPKNDLWAMGLILYECLHGDHLYTHLNKTEPANLISLRDLLFQLTQEQIDDFCKVSAPIDSFQYKMNEILKKILVLDVRNRASAKEISELYSVMFREELAQK